LCFAKIGGALGGGVAMLLHDPSTAVYFSASFLPTFKLSKLSIVLSTNE
jgi:hypothetical protein